MPRHIGCCGQTRETDGNELTVGLKSRADGDGRISLLGNRRLRTGLCRPARFTDAGPGLEEGEFSARKTAIMHEFVAHGATGPTTAEHRLVAIEPLFADFAKSGFDGKQHGLPVTAGFSDAHSTGV